MGWWENIKNYYTMLGKDYSVDPVIFVGIHIIATPLFAGAVWWLVYNNKKKRSIIPPAIAAFLIFNAANIYLISFGKNFPWWIYVVLAVTTIITSYFSIRKIRKKIIS